MIITRGGKATGFRGVRESDAPGDREGRSPQPDERGARRGRAEREVMVRSLPEVVIDAWDSSTRSEIRDLPDGRTVVAINKAHPVWSSANARYAIADGVITEVYRRGTEDVETFIARADEALAIWGQRQREADEE